MLMYLSRACWCWYQVHCASPSLRSCIPRCPGHLLHIYEPDCPKTFHTAIPDAQHVKSHQLGDASRTRHGAVLMTHLGLSLLSLIRVPDKIIRIRPQLNFMCDHCLQITTNKTRLTLLTLKKSATHHLLSNSEIQQTK